MRSKRSGGGGVLIMMTQFNCIFDYRVWLQPKHKQVDVHYNHHRSEIKSSQVCKLCVSAWRFFRWSILHLNVYHNNYDFRSHTHCLSNEWYFSALHMYIHLIFLLASRRWRHASRRWCHYFIRLGFCEFTSSNFRRQPHHQNVNTYQIATEMTKNVLFYILMSTRVIYRYT